jgi:hypothetical protein
MTTGASWQMRPEQLGRGESGSRRDGWIDVESLGAMSTATETDHQTQLNIDFG